MQSSYPVKVLEITNHELDQSAIDLTLTRDSETQGPFVVKQLDLHFSDTSKARTITLSKSANGIKKIIKTWVDDVNSSLLQTWEIEDGVIVDETETLRLEVTQLVAPAPITLVNGYVYIQKPKSV